MAMASTSSEPGHTVFCPENCSTRHNEMILALCACNDDTTRPGELTSLKLALYSHLQNGWNAQSSVPDVLPAFRFPLVHWACVLGKTQALSWLLTKMKFKGFVAAERTGETGLHRAVRLLHRVKSRDFVARSVDYIWGKFGHIVTALTDQDPNGLFLKDKVQGNSCFHICALCISQQESVGDELEFYENCMRILVERAVFLQNTEKLPSAALQIALNSQNDRGETVLHILARNNICRKTAKFLLSDFKERINKFVKNSEGETAFHVARSRNADLMEKELGGESVEMEQLVRTHSDVFQFHTQESDASEQQASSFDHATSTTGTTVFTVQLDLTSAVESGGHFLRLNSLVRRDGFYRSCSEQMSSSEKDSLSQDWSVGSPSLLDNVSVPEELLSASTGSNAIDSADSIVISDDAEDEPESKAFSVDIVDDECTVCVPVNLDNSITINIPDDDDDDATDASNVPACTGGESASNDTITRTKNAGSVKSDLEVPPETNGGCLEDDDCVSSEGGEVDRCGHELCLGEARSPLAKVIWQESDVASLLVARLRDRKERNRGEMRKAQRDLNEKRDKEGDNLRELQQLKAELETARAQEQNLERRREELMDELKNTENIVAGLREKSIQLQDRISEKAQVTENLRVDRERASDEYKLLKRKFAEYSKALSEISSPFDCSKTKKERLDDG